MNRLKKLTAFVLSTMLMFSVMNVEVSAKYWVFVAGYSGAYITAGLYDTIDISDYTVGGSVQGDSSGWFRMKWGLSEPDQVMEGEYYIVEWGNTHHVTVSDTSFQNVSSWEAEQALLSGEFTHVSGYTEYSNGQKVAIGGVSVEAGGFDGSTASSVLMKFVEEIPVLSVDTITTSNVKFKWTNIMDGNEDESREMYTDSYHVKYRVNNGSWSSEIDLGTDRNYTVSASANQKVDFQVIAYSDDSYDIGTTNVLTTYTAINTPSISSISNQSNGTENVITISKGGNPSSVTHYLYYREVGSGTWSKNSTNISGTTVTHSGSAGKNYEYKVEAVGINETKESATKTYYTNGQPTITVSGGDQMITESNDTITLSGTVTDTNVLADVDEDITVTATLGGKTKTDQIDRSSAITGTNLPWSITWDKSEFTSEFVTSNVKISVDDNASKDNSTNEVTYTDTIYYEVPNKPAFVSAGVGNDGVTNEFEIDKNGNDADVDHYLYYREGTSGSFNQYGGNIAGFTTDHLASAGTLYEYYIMARQKYGVTNGLYVNSDVEQVLTNGQPVVAVNNANIYLSDVNNTVTMSGTVSDVNPFNDAGTDLQVSATVNGITQTTTVSRGNNTTITDKAWSLTWNASQFNSEFVATGITVTANDMTGKSNSGNTTSFTGKVYYDTTKPAAPTNHATENWTSNAVVLSATSSDEGGIAAAQSGVDHLEVNLGSGWVTLVNQSITAEGIHNYSLRAVDKAGNVSLETSAVAKIDKSDPGNGGFAIKASGDVTILPLDEAYNVLFTNTETMNIVDIYSEDTGAGVSEYTLNNNLADLLTGTWHPYSDYTSYNGFVLTGGDEVKTVYMAVKDGTIEGNTTTYSDTIILDTTAPTINIGKPSRVAVRNGGVITFGIEGQDTSTGDIHHFNTFDGVNHDDMSKLSLEGFDINDLNVVVENVTSANADYKAQDNLRKVTITIPQDFSHEGMANLKILAGGALDKAGNVSLETMSDYSFIVDTTAPDYEDLLFSGDMKVQGGTLITLAGSSVDVGGESADSMRFASVDYVSEDYRAGVIGEILAPANARTVTSTHGTSDKIIAPIDEGIYYLYVVDAAGNVSLASDAALVVENEGPSIAIGQPTDTYVVEGETVTYPVVYSGESVITLDQEDVSLATTGTANGLVKIEDGADEHTKNIVVYNISGEGTLSIKVAKGTAIDDVGNEAGAALPGEIITIDATAPSVLSVGSFTTSNADPAKATGGDTVSLTFTTDEKLETYNVMLGGIEAEVTAVNDATYKAEITYDLNTALPEGEIKYSITGADAAANAMTEYEGNTGISLTILRPELSVEGYPQVITFVNGTGSLTNESTGATIAINSGYEVSVPGRYEVTVTSDLGAKLVETFDYEYHLVQLEADKSALDIGYQDGDTADAVKRDITLPQTMPEGSSVAWEVTGGDASLIDLSVAGTGTIKRPEAADELIQLTASLTNNEVTDTKEFSIKVLKQADNVSDKLEEEKNKLEVIYRGTDDADHVTQGLDLVDVIGTDNFTVTWEASNGSVVIDPVAVEGLYPTTVNRPLYEEGDTGVQLTATITGQDENDLDVTVTKTFDLTVTKQGTDEQFLEEYKTSISLQFNGDDTIDSVTEDFEFNYSGDTETAFTFTSSNLDIATIDADGQVSVVQPTEEVGDQVVEVKAILNRNGVQVEKSFDVTVKAFVEDHRYFMEEDLGSLEIKYFGTDNASDVTGPIVLPVTGENDSTITWTSNQAGVVYADGSVVRQNVDQTVTLTATVTHGDVTGERQFEIVVKAIDMDILHKLEYDYVNTRIGYQDGDDASHITGDILLFGKGAAGSNTEWSSSNTAVISNNGVVTRGAVDQVVTLSVKIELDGLVAFREIEVTVIAE